jgi:hypothetical protein
LTFFFYFALYDSIKITTIGGASNDKNVFSRSPSLPHSISTGHTVKRRNALVVRVIFQVLFLTRVYPMKHKSSKRPIPNKNHEQRRLSISSTAITNATTISSRKVDLGTGTVHLDSHLPCLKANATLRSQKALKRDLLRCSDQRPSLLGPQTLQPPRPHHGSQQSHTTVSASTDRQQPVRRRSLSFNSRTFYATIDRIGPWPDVSINRLRSDGNELLRPLKNFRNLKNPRVFSPKYFAALNESTSKFKFYSSTRKYIDEYRKEKGYLLGARTPVQVPLPISAPIQEYEDDECSVGGEFSGGGADLNNGTAGDRTILLNTELSLTQNGFTKSTNDLFEIMNTSPSIPAATKVFNEPHHSNNYPTIAMRNAHIRSTRHPPHHGTIAQQSQHQQAITLPTLTTSTFHYISSMSSVEKAYSNSKKASTPNQSKLFLIEKRQKKKYIYTLILSGTYKFNFFK